jgi:XTP/dITP diphosphohydrolase
MIPGRLVLATANPGKLRELGVLVSEWGDVEVLSLTAFPGVRLPEETGTTYRENAELKARAVAAGTGLPALADDSGLEVDALGGAPGIASARYARTDPERIAKLLAALTGRMGVSRTAAFRCAVVLAWPGGSFEVATGACVGRIAVEPVGAGGFGYDPIFESDELGQTLGTASPTERERVSHRARAMRALGARLRGISA